MMTSTSRVDVATSFPGLASRTAGTEALAVATDLLSELDAIALDFQGQNPSPSFADQFVGGLVARLGLPEFRRRVKLQNLAAPAQALMRHVILSRAPRS